jgi:succinate dehydrogenase / fumarate reductase flavoprotein subunit
VAKLEALGEVISTDLLVIGGGIGGLVAAIKAKEESSNLGVLIVDKATIGWAGKASKGGGIFCVLTPQYDLDRFVEYHVRNIGVYLNDQELLYAYAWEMQRGMEQLAAWGVNVSRTADGKLDLFARYSNTLSHGLWGIAGADLDMMLPLRAQARKAGIKLLNKVHVVDLLKQGDRVVGAVGFDINDGRFFILKAKAMIMANGGGSYKIRRMWAAASGDGIAAAYRAGAEMRNAEFGNAYHHVSAKDTDEGVDTRFLFNARGEELSQRYGDETTSAEIPIPLILAMESETGEGRGPIFEDLSWRHPDRARGGGAGSRDWKRPRAERWHARLAAKEQKYGPHRGPKREVTVYLHGELTPIKVDHDMKTTLKGLYAIGDASYEGSAMAGAVPAPRGGLGGSGLGFALFSALRGGPSAARFAVAAGLSEPDYTEAKQFKDDVFAPMQRDKGLSPAGAIWDIQNVVCPYKYMLNRSKDRLEEALAKIKEIENRFPKLAAKDLHYLAKCHEAKSMAVCAEMTFRAALMRTETRGWQVREDYPKRDDKNWLKWVIVKRDGQKMALSTEPVPIDKYKFRP